MTLSLSRRLLASPVARTVFAGLLLTNLMATAAVAVTDTSDSGTAVGSWCYANAAHDPDPDVKGCIKTFCHQRPTGALAKECRRKAEKQVKALVAEDTIF